MIGLDPATQSFDYDGRDLSIVVVAAATDAIEKYCDVADVHAPFFSLTSEMESRVRGRRRELLLKHARGFESVKDVAEDVRTSRREWARTALGEGGGGGARAAAVGDSVAEWGEVTTRAGNERCHRRERRVRDNRREAIASILGAF